jgi:hypothetical protein
MSERVMRSLLGTTIVAVVCLGVAFLTLTAERADPAERVVPREIVVVARDMAFFVNGGATPNPVISLKRGEAIALTLRNEDPGIVHDFAIPGWGVETRRLDGRGTDRVLFTVPDKAGTADYVCTPHSAMMFGILSIE